MLISIQMDANGDAVGNTYELRWESGRLQERGSVQGDKKPGAAEGWHENGNAAFTGTYANGKLWQVTRWNTAGEFEKE